MYIYILLFINQWVVLKSVCHGNRYLISNKIQPLRLFCYYLILQTAIILKQWKKSKRHQAYITSRYKHLVIYIIVEIIMSYKIICCFITFEPWAVSSLILTKKVGNNFNRFVWNHVYGICKRCTVRYFAVTRKCAILAALLRATCQTATSYIDIVRFVHSVRSTLVRRSSTGSSQYSQGQNRDTVTLTTIKETVTAQTPVSGSH